MPNEEFKLEQFVQLDSFYMQLESPDSSCYAWKEDRPQIVVDDVALDVGADQAPIRWGESLAFCTPTAAGTVIQFESDTYVGTVLLKGGVTTLLFGFEAALRAAGARVLGRLDEILLSASKEQT